MVLKALFIGCPLVPIQGLGERANPRLATMLRDFARERRAANRPAPRELWLCLAPFAEEVGAAEDLELALASDGTRERKIAIAAGEEAKRGRPAAGFRDDTSLES